MVMPYYVYRDLKASKGAERDMNDPSAQHQVSTKKHSIFVELYTWNLTMSTSPTP